MDFVSTKENQNKSEHVITGKAHSKDKSPASPSRLILRVIVVLISVEIASSAIILVLNPLSLLHALLTNLAILIILFVPAGYFVIGRTEHSSSSVCSELKGIISGPGQLLKNPAGGMVCKKDGREWTDQGAHYGDQQQQIETLMQANQDWQYTFDTIPDVITIHDRN